MEQINSEGIDVLAREGSEAIQFPSGVDHTAVASMSLDSVTESSAEVTVRLNHSLSQDVLVRVRTLPGSATDSLYSPVDRYVPHPRRHDRANYFCEYKIRKRDNYEGRPRVLHPAEWHNRSSRSTDPAGLSHHRLAVPQKISGISPRVFREWSVNSFGGRGGYIDAKDCSAEDVAMLKSGAYNKIRVWIVPDPEKKTYYDQWQPDYSADFRQQSLSIPSIGLDVRHRL